MPEPGQITFKYKEVVEALIKQSGLHEGIWGLWVRFGLKGANIGDETSDEVRPAAVIPILELGLQKFEKENNISVDASIVNPKSKTGVDKR